MDIPVLLDSPADDGAGRRSRNVSSSASPPPFFVQSLLWHIFMTHLVVGGTLRELVRRIVENVFSATKARMRQRVFSIVSCSGFGELTVNGLLHL